MGQSFSCEWCSNRTSLLWKGVNDVHCSGMTSFLYQHSTCNTSLQTKLPVLNLLLSWSESAKWAPLIVRKRVVSCLVCDVRRDSHWSWVLSKPLLGACANKCKKHYLLSINFQLELKLAKWAPNQQRVKRLCKDGQPLCSWGHSKSMLWFPWQVCDNFPLPSNDLHHITPNQKYLESEVIPASQRRWLCVVRRDNHCSLGLQPIVTHGFGCVWQWYVICKYSHTILPTSTHSCMALCSRSTEQYVEVLWLKPNLRHLLTTGYGVLRWKWKQCHQLLHTAVGDLVGAW